MKSSVNSTSSEARDDSLSTMKLTPFENTQVQSLFIREWVPVKHVSPVSDLVSAPLSSTGEFSILTYNILANVALNHYYNHLPLHLKYHPHRWRRIVSELANYSLPDIVLLQVIFKF